jgi:hypothetical protein
MGDQWRFFKLRIVHFSFHFAFVAAAAAIWASPGLRTHVPSAGGPRIVLWTRWLLYFLRCFKPLSIPSSRRNEGLFSSRAFPLNPSIRPQHVPTHICGPVAAEWLHMHQNSLQKHKVKQWRAGSLSFRLLARFGCLQWDHSQPTRRALCATGNIKRAVHKHGDSQDSPRPPATVSLYHRSSSSASILELNYLHSHLYHLHTYIPTHKRPISYPMDQFTDIFTMVAVASESPNDIPIDEDTRSGFGNYCVVA